MDANQIRRLEPELVQFLDQFDEAHKPSSGWKAVSGTAPISPRCRNKKVSMPNHTVDGTSEEAFTQSYKLMFADMDARSKRDFMSALIALASHEFKKFGSSNKAYLNLHGLTVDEVFERFRRIFGPPIESEELDGIRHTLYDPAFEGESEGSK